MTDIQNQNVNSFITQRPTLMRKFCLVKSDIFLRPNNRPFSYSGKESQSNDVMMQFEEFSNVHNSDRISNASRSNFAYKIV